MNKEKIVPLAIIALMFSIFGFVLLNFNPFEWNWVVRFLYVIFTGTAIGVWYENKSIKP